MEVSKERIMGKMDREREREREREE